MEELKWTEEQKQIAASTVMERFTLDSVAKTSCRAASGQAYVTDRQKPPTEPSRA